MFGLDPEKLLGSLLSNPAIVGALEAQLKPVIEKLAQFVAAVERIEQKQDKILALLLENETNAGHNIEQRLIHHARAG
jgi:hypothetical protein